MEFGPVSAAAAEGMMLAHSVRAGERRLSKGRLLSAADIRALLDAGVDEVWAARPGADDIAEDDAAAHIAAALEGPALSLSAPFTGRVNVYAEADGVLRVNAAAVLAANEVDEAVTIATLPDFARVKRRQMLATVKIIPYAAPGAAVRDAAEKLKAALALHPFRPGRAALILTKTPGMKPSLLTKGAEVIRARLTSLGLEMAEPVEAAHETGALKAAIEGAREELILILSASATSDRRDVAPAALEAAGGRIERFGMPVDPGNLLFTGSLNGRRVLGLPGCARSPKPNGADWVLERLAARMSIESADIARMGVGGLLKEIPSRPQPRGGRRAPPPGRPSVSAILLAAGASSRMKGRDKLMEDVGGEPLLRRAAGQLLASQADELVVVLRPEDEARRAALDGLTLRITENPQASEGMGASIRAGMAAISEVADCALIALADMPAVTAKDINRLIAAFDPAEEREIIRAATEDGRPGNPVLFSRRFFEALAALEGDQGARALFAASQELTRLTPFTGDAALTDLDSPEDWARWRSAQNQRGT